MSSQPTERNIRPKNSPAGSAGVLDRLEEPAAQLNEDRDTLVKVFHQMLLLRRFEEKCAESYSLGKIGGFCHLYIGQEAVGVGAISVLRPDDYVLTSYREHGQAIAKGISPEAVMAELYGKATGCSKGKGGSMHMFDKDVNFLGGHAIVGGQIPLATGVAFAAKYQETDRVTLCFFGEAAVNQGAFHESLNMAQLWKLPCIYICENNMYGMGTSLERAMSFQRRSHAIHVVFADIDAGKFPELSHVQRFMKSALVHCGFTEETQCNSICFLIFRGKSDSGC